MKNNQIKNIIDRLFETENDDKIRSAYLSMLWFSKNAHNACSALLLVSIVEGHFAASEIRTYDP